MRELTQNPSPVIPTQSVKKAAAANCSDSDRRPRNRGQRIKDRLLEGLETNAVILYPTCILPHAAA